MKTRAAVSPIVSVPGTQMKLKSLRCDPRFCIIFLPPHTRSISCGSSLRYVWEGEQVRVTADITSSDLLRIEVKAHTVRVICTASLCIHRTHSSASLFSASPPSISCASCDLQQPQCALQAVQSAPRSLRPPTLSCLLHPRNLGLSFAWSIQQLPNQ